MIRKILIVKENMSHSLSKRQYKMYTKKKIKTIAATATTPTTASNETNVLPSSNNTKAASTSSSSNEKTKPPQEEIQHLHTFHNANTEINHLKNDLLAAKEEISHLKALLSVPVIDVDDPDLKETTMVPPTHVLAQSVQRKRQRLPKDSTQAVAVRNQKKRKIKVDHLEKAANDAKEAAVEANEKREEAAERLDDLETRTECMVCNAATVKILCLPCNHLVVCGGCFPMIKIKDGKCIKCRREVAATIEVGFP